MRWGQLPLKQEETGAEYVGIRAVNAVVAMVVLVLSGCFGGSTPAAGGSTPAVDGLRTDPDGQGLVASYIGGSCDGSALLVVDEAPTRIDVSVAVKPLLGIDACDSVGHSRTVATRLEQPVGTRAIWSGGRQQVPFDGARLLLVPTADLPADLTGIIESGDAAKHMSGPDEAAVTADWHTKYLRSAPATPSSTCTPGRGFLDIHLGPASRAALTGWTPLATADVGTTKAQLYREGSRRAPTGLAYTWMTHQGSVEVLNQASCRGDRLLSAAELLGVARALRPA